MAGLGAASLLAGWRPRLEGPVPGSLQHPPLGGFVEAARDDLMAMDMSGVAEIPVSPYDVFRLLHHPQRDYEGLDAYPMRWERRAGLDWALFSDERPGGLWNDVPRNQLTLSPAHLMEISAYPIARFFADAGMDRDPNDLIIKQDLVAYYHAVPGKLRLVPRMNMGCTVTSLSPGDADDAPRFKPSAPPTTGPPHATLHEVARQAPAAFVKVLHQPMAAGCRLLQVPVQVISRHRLRLLGIGPQHPVL